MVPLQVVHQVGMVVEEIIILQEQLTPVVEVELMQVVEVPLRVIMVVVVAEL